MKTTPILNLDDLWVGDKVKIISSGKIGVFEGIGKNGKARIKYQDKILLVSASNLTEEGIIESDENVIDKDFTKFSVEDNSVVREKKPLKYHFKNVIDLHIEKLNPQLEHAHPQMILDHQLEMCKAFVENSIGEKRNVVTIIHGRGRGALRDQVLHMLKDYGAVRFAIEVNYGGAHEVWFR